MRAVLASAAGLACKERRRQPIQGKFTQDLFIPIHVSSGKGMVVIGPDCPNLARPDNSTRPVDRQRHCPSKCQCAKNHIPASCQCAKHHIPATLASFQTANGRREACNMLCVKGLVRTQNLTIVSSPARLCPALCQLRQEPCTHTYMIHARYMQIHAHTYNSYLDIFSVIVL